MGVFKGLRVLELADDIAGEYAGLTCAARGAEVIKLEPPEGDRLRHTPGGQTGDSKLFLALNRGKKSICISPADAMPLIEKLLETADIVITSASRGQPLYPLSYDEVQARNPRTIYLSISSFGEQGRWAGKYANDLIMQAFAGAMMSERKVRADGVTPAAIRSTRFSEFGTGMMASIGISAALFHRAKTGQGQCVRTSLLHNMLLLQGGRAVENHAADISSAPIRQKLKEGRDKGANLRTLTTPLPVVINAFYRSYQTQDGAVFVGALTRSLRDKARAALKTNLMLRDDPNWDPDDPVKVSAAEAEQIVIEQRVKAQPTVYWTGVLEAAGVPTGEVVFPEDLATTKHLHDNQYLFEVHQPDAGMTLQVAPPVRFARFPFADAKPAPGLGEHTASFLD